MAHDSKVAHQIVLEELYSKNQLIPRIKAEFQKEQKLMEAIENMPLPEDFSLDLMVQMVLHKRTNVPTLVGLLRHYFNSGQETADALLKAVHLDLVDWNPNVEQFITRFTLSNDVQEELDRFQFPLPMIVPPKKVTNNKQCGYLTSRGSIILKNNHHDDDVCLDHINRMNNIPLQVDDVVAVLIKNQWKGLDKVGEGETEADLKKHQRAFEKYDRTTADVMKLLRQEGNHFYLTHRPDKRGRTYCQGYHVNYQGNPWNKAVIAFANEELIDEE